MVLIKWAWQQMHCMMEVFIIESFMHGVTDIIKSKDFWSPVVSESFLCELEEDNTHDAVLWVIVMAFL